MNDILNKARFLVKAANLPASNVAPIEVPFRGRVLKIAIDRTFDTWTITIINDTDFAIRSAFEKWMNTINRVSDNTGTTNPADYQADAFVFQLDRGETLRKYHFYDVFPTQVAPIELSYDAQGIQEFRVELKFFTGKQLKVTVLTLVERTLTNHLNSAIIEVKKYYTMAKLFGFSIDGKK